MRTRTSLKRRFGKAFTLIELLIVITIIGILAVALIPRVTQGPAKARDVKRKSDVQNIGTALELYYSDQGSYPTGAGVCASALITAVTTDIDLSSYTQAIPSDPDVDNTNLGPSCAGEYYYKQLGSSFVAVGHLEQEVSGGDNIYCGPLDFGSATSYSDALTLLTAASTPSLAAPCAAGTAYFVILR